MVLDEQLRKRKEKIEGERKGLRGRVHCVTWARPGNLKDKKMYGISSLRESSIYLVDFNSDDPKTDMQS